MWLVARRVAEIYSELCAGREPQGEAFGSLAALLDEDAAYRASGQFDSDRQYWRDALAARPEPGRLTLSDRPSTRSASFLRETLMVPRSCEEALRGLAARSRDQPCARHGRGDGDLAASPQRGRRCGDRAAGGGAERGGAAHSRDGLQRVAAAACAASRHDGGRGPRAGFATASPALQHQRYQLTDMRRDVGGESKAEPCSGSASTSCRSTTASASPAIRHRAQSVARPGRGPVDLGLRPLGRPAAADRFRRQSGAAHGGRSGRLSPAISAAADGVSPMPSARSATWSCWSAPSAAPSCEQWNDTARPVAQLCCRSCSPRRPRARRTPPRSSVETGR